MQRNLLRILLLILAPISSATAIDLTPRVEEYVGEGVLYHRVVFKQEKRSITMELPNQWSCAGAGDRARLVPPPAYPFAEGVIVAALLQKPQLLDETATAAFKQQVLASLPPGNQSVTVVADIENSLSVDGNPGYEFVVSYKLLGRTFQRSAILIYLPGVRLTFQFTATDRDFSALNRTFRHAVMSGQWAEPLAPDTIVAQKDQPSGETSRR